MSQSLAVNRRPYRRELFLICLVALGLRLGYVAFQGFNLPPDTDAYRAIADNLVSGHGYSLVPGVPTAYRPPGYVFFVAIVSLLPGGHWAVIFAQCVLGAFVSVLAALLARRLVGDLFALAAAAIVAVDPYLVAVCNSFMTECLFAFLVTAFFLLFVASLHRGAFFLYVAAALSAALAFLTRPEFIACLPVAAFAVLASKRRPLASFVLFVVAFAAVVSPWPVRNRLSIGQTLFTTTHGGYTHRLPYNFIFCDRVVVRGEEVWDAGSRSLAEWRSRVDAESDALGEIARDRNNYRIAAGFLFCDVRRALRVALYEARSFWRPYPHGIPKATSFVLGAFFTILAALTVAGGLIAWRWGPFIPCLLAVLLIETAVHMYYWSNVRMRVPFHPLMAVAASVAVAAMFRRKAAVHEPVRAAPARPFCKPA